MKYKSEKYSLQVLLVSIFSDHYCGSLCHMAPCAHPISRQIVFVVLI